MAKSKARLCLDIGDYLADTMHLQAREHGAYLLLMMHRTHHGSLPDDDDRLAAIARMDRDTWDGVTGPAVRPLLALEDAGISQKRSSAGTSGAVTKWGRSEQPDHSATRSARITAARLLGTHTAEQWHLLVIFCGKKCVRCQAFLPLVRDHIKPLYQGGSDSIDNIQPLCRHCNSAKGPESIDYRPAGWACAVLFDNQEMPSKMPSKMPDVVQPSRVDSLTQSTEVQEKEVSKSYAPQQAAMPIITKSARGHRIPEDWQPTVSDAAFAISRHLDPQETAAHFRDYWMAAAGRTATKMNWSLAFKVWCRSAKPSNGGQKGARMSQTDLIRARWGMLHDDVPEHRSDGNNNINGLLTGN